MKKLLFTIVLCVLSLFVLLSVVGCNDGTVKDAGSDETTTEKNTTEETTTETFDIKDLADASCKDKMVAVKPMQEELDRYTDKIYVEIGSYFTPIGWGGEQTYDETSLRAWARIQTKEDHSYSYLPLILKLPEEMLPFNGYINTSRFNNALVILDTSKKPEINGDYAVMYVKDIEITLSPTIVSCENGIIKGTVTDCTGDHTVRNFTATYSGETPEWFGKTDETPGYAYVYRTTYIALLNARDGEGFVLDADMFDAEEIIFKG